MKNFLPQRFTEFLHRGSQSFFRICWWKYGIL